MQHAMEQIPQIGEAPTRYIPITKWPLFHPWPTVNQIRQYRFNGKKNGFDVCVKKVGGTVLIDEQAFFKWVESHNEEGIRQ